MIQLVVTVKSWVNQLNLAVGDFDLPGYEKLWTKYPLYLA